MTHRHSALTLCLASALMTSAGIAPAWANEPAKDKPATPAFQVSRLGDTELHCAALAKEAYAMRDIIIANQGIESDSEVKSRGISAAGAVGSILLGTVTAGVGLAAAGFMATEAVDNEADKADHIKEMAAQRRSFMVGIYNAKGCQGPIEYVMRGPVPVTRTANAQGHIASTATPIKPKEQPRVKPQSVSYHTEEKRIAGPIATNPAMIAPAAGKPEPEFSFND